MFLVDPKIDPDHMLIDSVTKWPVKEPVFSVGDVAKIFFAKTPYWVRWREEKGFFTLEGKKVGTKRSKPTGESKLTQRRYSIFDVEAMAYGLAEKGAVDQEEFRRIIKVVAAVATLWGYFDEGE